jgi:hypothetical protein
MLPQFYKAYVGYCEHTVHADNLINIEIHDNDRYIRESPGKVNKVRNEANQSTPLQKKHSSDDMRVPEYGVSLPLIPVW